MKEQFDSELNLDKKESESIKDAGFEDYENNLEIRTDLADSLKEASVDAEKTKTELEELRGSMNIENKEESEPVFSKNFQDNQKRLTKMDETIEEMERNLLKYPEESPEAEELLEYVSEIERNREEMDKMEKNMRAKYIKREAEEIVKNALDYYRSDLSQCLNKENGEKFFAVKLKQLVILLNKDYLENGVWDPGRYTYSMKIASFKNQKGKTMKYVTGAGLEFRSYKTIKSLENEKNGLVDKKGQKNLDAAKKDGTLKEENKK